MSDAKKARKRVVNSSDMEAFLASMNLSVRPKLHINGPQYLGAIVTVDIGEPLEPVRLSNEQMHDLVSNMRSLARDVLGRDASISINTDNQRGIMWASQS